MTQKQAKDGKGSKARGSTVRGTLRSRLMILLGTASAFSLIVFIGTFLYLSHDVDTFFKAMEREQQVGRIGSAITQSVTQQMSKVLGSFNTGGGELYSGFEGECLEVRTRIETIQKLDLEITERIIVEQIKIQHQDLEALILNLASAREVDPDLDTTEKTQRMVILAQQLDGEVLRLMQAGRESLKECLIRFEGRKNRAATLLITGGIGSILLFSLIGLLYTRRVLSPLDERTAAAARMGEGKYDIQVSRGRVAEVDRLSGSFNLMADALLQTEKQQSANRLESIGILAGGIAHDFNNFLMAIYGTLTMARREIDPDSPALELLEEAEAASLRAKNLTQQLLTFARGGRPVKKPASVRRVVRQAVEFAQRGTAMRADFSLPNDLWRAELDKGQVGQVFSNLAINAEQSMPGGGTLVVSANNVEVEERSPLPLSAGPHVRISVRDRGTVILPEHRPHIFDPYFTTKRRGSGLGLAVAQSVITRHGGFITVESELGKGSQFHVYLPADPELKPDTVQKAETIGLAGRGPVLVMDDEESVLKVTGMLLSDLGYQPQVARDGEGALALFQEAEAEDRPFVAVICDLVVPGGMGGVEAAKRLKSIAPDVPVIASSGYANDAVLSEPEVHGFDDGLAKPFSIDELSRVLSRLVNG